MRGIKWPRPRGGQADFAPRTEREIALLSHLRRQLSHVSCEEIVSGRGFRRIHKYLNPAVVHESFESAGPMLPVTLRNADWRARVKSARKRWRFGLTYWLGRREMCSIGHGPVHSRRRQTLHHLGAAVDSVFYSAGKGLGLGMVAIPSHPADTRRRPDGKAGKFFNVADGDGGNRGGAGRRICFLWCPRLAFTLRERPANRFPAGQPRVCR